MGTVTARVTTDNSQFDAAMLKSSEVVGATARENAKAMELQAKAVALAAKLGGDAVSEQTLRIIAAMKAQTAADADMRAARKLTKGLDEEGGTQLLAAAYQRLTTAKLETAAASRVEAAATEATVLTQRSAVSAVVRATEGQQGIRAVEGFLTMIPGVGAALQAIFPLVGGAMFLGLLAKMGTELYDLEQKAVHAADESRRAWAEFNGKLAMTNDELALTDSKLRDEIAKLEGHPNNGLATALLEAKIAADRLGESMDADIRKMQSLLKEQSVSFTQGLLGGTRPTGPADKEIKEQSDKLQDAINTAREGLTADLQVAKNAHVLPGRSGPARQKAADDALNLATAEAQLKYNHAVSEAASKFAAWSDQQAKQVPGRDSIQKQIGNVVGFGPAGLIYERTHGGDPKQIIEQYQAAARAGRSMADMANLNAAINADTGVRDHLQGAKAGAGAEDSAQKKAFEAMKATLEQQKLLHGMSLAEEEGYWEKMLAAAKKGTELYKLIVPEVLKAQRAVMDVFVRGSIEDAEAAKRESAEIHDTLERTWTEMDRADRERKAKDEAASRYEAVHGDRANFAAMESRDRMRLFTLGRGEYGAQARAMQAIHSGEYQAQVDAKNRQLTGVSTSETLTTDEKREQIAAIKDEIAELGRQRQLQMAEDDARIQSTTLLGGANDALAEFVRSATDAGAAMKTWFGGAINSTNDAIVKSLTTHGPHQQLFSQAGHEIFTSATSSLLKYGEGSLLKGLGFGGKADGSESNPFWVKVATGAKGGAGAAGTASGGVAGWLSKLFHPKAMDDDSSGDGGDQKTSISTTGGGRTAGGGGFMDFLGKLLGASMKGMGNSDSSGGGGGDGTLFGGGGNELDGSDSGGSLFGGGDNELASYDVGTNYVPSDMVAQIHKGEAIVPAKFNPDAFGGGAPVIHMPISVDARGSMDPAQVEAAGYRGAMAAMPAVHAAVLKTIRDTNSRYPPSRKPY